MMKLRIVHILHSFGIGGLEKGIATLINNSSEDLEHTVLCLSASGDSARLLPPGVKIYELKKRSGNSLLFLWTLIRTLRSLDPDIVHTRNWGGMDGIIAARLAGVKSIIHGEHGWAMEDPEGQNPRRIRIRRVFSRWVEEYTCVSKKIEKWLRTTVHIKKPLTQIYNGVDTEKYRPHNDPHKARTNLGITHDTHLIGSVGRLDPIKDHETLFRAFAEVKRREPRAQLLVVGNGPKEEYLKSIGGEGVIFLGKRLDVPEILQALDVFVLPSRNEGISNTILEAMATGVAVVATNVGGNGEIVEDRKTGMLVEPGDPTGMALAISLYLEDVNLRRLHGDAARQRTVNHFTVKSMVRSYEEVYRRLGDRYSIKGEPL